MALNSIEIENIVVSIVVVLFIVRRLYSLTQGVPISALRISFLPVLILVAFLWGTAEFESLLLIPWALPYLVALDLAILVGTTIALTPLAERMTEVRLDSAGGGTIRISASLGALFVGAYLARLAITILLFPSALEFGNSPAVSPPLVQQEILAGIDALLSFSAGLLMARTFGLRRKLAAARAASPAARSS